MRALLVYCSLSILILGCGSRVESLSLRDSRLPLEARRWLADAEDEVAITNAQVADAEEALARVTIYRDETVNRLKGSWAPAGAEGGKAWQAFKDYADSRVTLAELVVTSAMMERDLAQKRLTQARAETAIRYDLDVYELGSLIDEMLETRKAVAEIIKKVEYQRVEVEKKADVAWQSFYSYANKGGVTNALWYEE